MDDDRDNPDQVITRSPALSPIDRTQHISGASSDSDASDRADVLRPDFGRRHRNAPRGERFS